MKVDRPITVNDIPAEHRQMIELYKNNLLIIFLDRLGGNASIPIELMDDYPIGRGVALAITGMKDAPDRGPGMMDGTFVLEVTESPNVKIPTLPSDNEAILGALVRLVGTGDSHMTGCNRSNDYTQPCTCGADDARYLLGAKEDDDNGRKDQSPS